MTTQNPEPPDSLDEFTQGYYDGLFFTEDGPEDDGGSIGEKTYYDFAPELHARIKADCADFQRENAELLALAYKLSDYDAKQAGIDFWLSRNGHGAGFFDRKLDGLQSACGFRTKFPEFDLYIGDDGQVYHG